MFNDESHPDDADVSFVVAGRFAWGELRLEPGEELAYVSDEWDGAMVVVSVGDLEIDCLGGGTRRFRTGSILALAGVPLDRLRAAGGEATVLVTVRRRRL